MCPDIDQDHSPKLAQLLIVRLLNMKKILPVLLCICLLLTSAMAGLEDGTFHYPLSVVNNEEVALKPAYSAFFQASEFSILMPGLAQQFVPQGLAYYAPKNLMIFTGYDGVNTGSKKTSSTLLGVDMSNNWIEKEIFLKNPDGSYYTGHAGGVCVTDKNIFISDNNCLYRLSMNDFQASGISGTCTFAEVIPLPVTASFCQISNGILWVGEFHHIPKDPTQKAFRTDPSHRVDATSSQQNAWLVGYRLSGGTENELDTACITAAGAIPDYILSIPDRIQGFTICNDQLYLSQSYGRTNESTIFRFNNVLANAPDQQVSVLGSTRPLWVLDANAPDCKKLTAPPMSEGLCTIGDSVFISFESAAQTYRQPKDPSKGVSKDPVDRVIKLNPSAF